MKNKKISIILAHSDKKLRKDFKIIINGSEKLILVAEASNGRELIELLEKYYCDIVFMAIYLAEINGVEVTRIIVNKYPHIKVIAISEVPNDNKIIDIDVAGAFGFITRCFIINEIEEAVKKVNDGRKYYSLDILPFLTNDFLMKNFIRLCKLTKREIEVLKLLLRDFTDIEISEELGISVRTVEGHKSKLIKKTKTGCTKSLIIFAINNKLLGTTDKYY